MKEWQQNWRRPAQNNYLIRFPNSYVIKYIKIKYKRDLKKQGVERNIQLV